MQQMKKTARFVLVLLAIAVLCTYLVPSEQPFELKLYDQPTRSMSASHEGEFTIPWNMRVIEEEAFAGSVWMRSVIIPRGVTEIGNGAFSGCSALTDVYFEGTEQRWNSIAIGEDNDPLLNAALHCAGVIDIDVTEEVWTGESAEPDEEVWIGDGSDTDEEIWIGDGFPEEPVEETTNAMLRGN